MYTMMKMQIRATNPERVLALTLGNGRFFYVDFTA